MEFFWANPLALWLGVLLVAPILAHLIQKKPRNKIIFGAMMLLKRLENVKRRRRRLADWLLLLLRLLLISALVFAATRPELRWYEVKADHTTPRKVILIIDNSLSMNHKMVEPLHPSFHTALEHARYQANEVIQSAAESSSFLIISAGGAAEQRGEWAQEKSSAMSNVLDISRGFSRTDIVGAIRIARRALEGKGGVVYLFTDEAGEDASSGLTDELQLLVEQNASFVPIPVRAKEPQNISVVSAEYSTGIEGGTVRYQVMNYGSREREVLCTTKLPDGTEIRGYVKVSAESMAENFITVPRITEGGVASIAVDDDELVEDNDFYFHLPRIGASRVLVIDGEPGATASTSEVYFLERALAPFGGQNETLPDVVNAGGWQKLQPDIHKVVFMANVMEPTPMSSTLMNFVQDGGGVLISLGSNVSAAQYNSALGNLLPARLKTVQSFSQHREDGEPMAIPNLQHELFSLFQRGGAVEFSGVRWKSLFSIEKIDEGAKVLLSLENGSPVLIEKEVGKGRVLLLLGSIDYAWSNFPFQSIFLPFIQRSVQYLGGASSLGGKRVSGYVDEEMKIDLRDAQSDISLEGTKGAIGLKRDGDSVLFQPRYAGAYQLRVNGAPAIAQVAINHIPKESDVRVSKPLIEIAAQTEPDRFIQKRPLLKWLLWTGLILVLLQSLLSFFTPGDDGDVS